MQEHRSVFDYDADNNLTGVSTFTGGSATPNVSELSATYTSTGQVKDWTETIYPPSGADPVTVSGSADWQNDGLIAAKTIDGKTSSFEWYLDSQEKGFDPFAGQGSFSSSYFADGALQLMSLPDGQELEHNYDAAGRLAARTVSFGSSVLSAWEQIGYDLDNHRISEQVTQRYPVLDGSGNVTDVQSGSGAAAYGYDDLGRLESFKHAFETLPTSYTLDDAGNITAEGSELFTYENNRLKVRTELIGVFEYDYDLLGNQIAETELGQNPTTTDYDAAGFTRRVTEPDGSWVEYRYDGLERMVARLDSQGEETLFFHDGLAQQVALETDSSGNVQMRYLTDAYAAPRGQMDEANGGQTSYYVTDPRGNLTQSLAQSSSFNPEADLVAALNYDPYGQSLEDHTSVADGWDSRLKFQLAPEDPLTGSYNIGPRVMDPSINRFVGADMYVGAAANLGLQIDPLTGNRYLYAGANPIGLIDDGHGVFGLDCIGPTNDDGGCGWAKPFKKKTELEEPIALAIRKERPGDDKCIPTPRGLSVEQQKALIQAGKYCTALGEVYEPVEGEAHIGSGTAAWVGIIGGGVVGGGCLIAAGIATGPAAPAGVVANAPTCFGYGSGAAFVIEEAALIIVNGKPEVAPAAGYGVGELTRLACKKIARAPIGCSVAGTAAANATSAFIASQRNGQ